VYLLEPCGRSEWIAGTFIIPTKDGRVRWISDFRGLNKALKRKVYPIPRIADILARRSGYAFLSKMDISMQYYTFELDDESKELCTIATPFGLFRYKRLPMGVSVAPDIAQETMETVLRKIDDKEIYIDDIAAFSKDWTSHLKTLDSICSILEKHGLRLTLSNASGRSRRLTSSVIGSLLREFAHDRRKSTLSSRCSNLPT